MATPVYNGGGGWRRGGYGRRWGQNPEPTGNGWLGRLGSWLGGETPPYAGQPTAGTIGGGSVYLPAPQSVRPSGDAVTTTPQNPTVIVVPRG